MRGTLLNESCNDDPHEVLLTAIIKRAVLDIRQSTNQAQRQDGWRFLWEVAPTVAQRLLREEGIKQMEAVAEQMSHKEAELAFKEWEEKLQLAQDALTLYEGQIGQIALTAGAENATQGLVRAQVEVKMAEAGFAAAKIQRDNAQRREQLQRIVELRAEVKKLNAEADRFGATMNELGTKLQEAREQFNYRLQRASVCKRQIEDLEARYGKAGAA